MVEFNKILESKKYIFANGCSHTAGGEMEFTFQNTCYEKAWPTKMAQLLEKESINLAVSGGSSKSIVRTTMLYFGTYPQRLKDSFVIIGWPGPHRSEIRTGHEVNSNIPKEVTKITDDEYWLHMAPGNNESFKKRMKQGNIDKNLFNYYRMHYAMTSERQFWEEYFVHLISLQSYFKALRVPYLFYSTANVLHEHSQYNNLLKQIDTRHWLGNPFNQKDTYHTQLNNAGFNFPEWSKTNHYGEDGHAWWAERLISYIANP